MKDLWVAAHFFSPSLSLSLFLPRFLLTPNTAFYSSPSPVTLSPCLSQFHVSAEMLLCYIFNYLLTLKCSFLCEHSLCLGRLPLWSVKNWITTFLSSCQSWFWDQGRSVHSSRTCRPCTDMTTSQIIFIESIPQSVSCVCIIFATWEGLDHCKKRFFSWVMLFSCLTNILLHCVIHSCIIYNSHAALVEIVCTVFVYSMSQHSSLASGW